MYRFQTRIIWLIETKRVVEWKTKTQFCSYGSKPIARECDSSFKERKTLRTTCLVIPDAIPSKKIKENNAVRG